MWDEPHIPDPTGEDENDRDWDSDAEFDSFYISHYAEWHVLGGEA